jgi:hypothetical protein
VLRAVAFREKVCDLYERRLPARCAVRLMSNEHSFRSWLLDQIPLIPIRTAVNRFFRGRHFCDLQPPEVSSGHRDKGPVSKPTRSRNKRLRARPAIGDRLKIGELGFTDHACSLCESSALLSGCYRNPSPCSTQTRWYFPGHDPGMIAIRSDPVLIPAAVGPAPVLVAPIGLMMTGGTACNHPKDTAIGRLGRAG